MSVIVIPEREEIQQLRDENARMLQIITEAAKLWEEWEIYLGSEIKHSGPRDRFESWLDSVSEAAQSFISSLPTK